MTQPKANLASPPFDDFGRRTQLRAWSMAMPLVLVYVINSADKAVLGLAAQPLPNELGCSHSCKPTPGRRPTARSPARSAASR